VALGHAPSTDSELSETPRRVVEALADDLLSGYDVDVEGLLSRGRCASSASHASIVAITDIFVATLCPHHLLPATGTATVVYVPGPSLVGLGTLAALVDAFARRLTLQERIGELVVEALVGSAHARGAYCRLTLDHSCLQARGARQGQAQVSTVALSGDLTLEQVAAATAHPSLGSR